jgi:hypothetical protein
MKPKPIAIDLIRIDAGTQFRAATNQAKVTEYAEMFQASTEWPFDTACEVFFDGNEYFMADGFHRYLGAVSVKRSSLSCNVTNGSLRDAIKFALSANARHGLHRSNEDKRKAVLFVLDDSEWAQLSNRAIAEICGVSEYFVRDMVKKYGRESPPSGAIKSQVKGKDGKEYPATKPKADPKPEPKDDIGDNKPEPSFEVPGHGEGIPGELGDVWEDVDEEPIKPEHAETPQAKPEPSAKERAASLKSIIKQHNAAMMRAVDDLHGVMPNELCRDIAHKSFRTIHEVVEAWR